MSVLKTVGVVGAISGIGLIGYYYLNKKKPTIAQQQKDELQGNLFVLPIDRPESRKIWSIIAKYYYDNIDPNTPASEYLPFINRLLTEKPLVISLSEKRILEQSMWDVLDKGNEVFYKLIGEDLKKFLQKIGGWGKIYFQPKKSPDFLKNSENRYFLQQDNLEYRKIWSIIAKYGYEKIDKSNPQSPYRPLINKVLTANPLILSESEKNDLETAKKQIQPRIFFNTLIGKDLETFIKIGENYLGLAFRQEKTSNPVQEQFTKLNYSYSKPFESVESRRIVDLARWYDRYYNPYKNENIYFTAINPSGKDISFGATNCAELDRDIKKIIDRIAEQTRTAPNEDRRRVLSWYKDILEDYSEFQACRDKIEQQRALDLAKQVTVSSITAEASVLGANQKSQDIYLGIGAVVLVLSTAILLSGGGSNTSTPTSGSSNSSGVMSSLVVVGGLSGMGYLIFKKPKAQTTSDVGVGESY